MANYTKATNFASKDSLLTGNPSKLIRGSEIDSEFNAISTAIATKADTNSPTFTGTPTVPTASAGTNTTQIASTAFVTTAVAGSIPAGLISLWSGSVASIPSGWYLCNGSNGTPDLRDKFVVGAGSTYAVGATGGSKDAIVVAHSHTATSTVSDPGHNHASFATSNPNGGAPGASLASAGWSAGSHAVTTSTTGITVSTSVASTGSSGTDANLPPYYALCYIMKA